MFFSSSRFSFLKRSALALLAAAFCASASQAAAADGQQMLTTGGKAPWSLNADRLISLDDGVIVEASGGVLLQRGEDYVKADFARYYTATNWIFIKGNVEARMGRDTLNAAEAEFDLGSRTGWLKDGSIFIAGPHMYVKGERVDKLYGDRYRFENAKVTACDGDRPAWSFSAGQADIEIDGYARLSHMTLNILDVPVMDAPYLILPAKTTRQSGLLMPDFGYSSVNGSFYAQPYFHVIDQSRDLTFTGTYMSRVGFMPSLEYRSHTRDQEKTWISLDLLYDKHTFSNDSGDPVNSVDRLVNTNEERYWIRGMGDGFLGDGGWRYRYNLDYVSDQNYLRQFREMETGFDNTRDELFDMFGRDIPEVDKNRVSEGFLYKDWDRFMLSLGYRYEQDPSFGHGNRHHSEDTTVQRLPMNAYLFKSRLLPEFPLEVQGHVSASYEYRAKGVRGLRTEIHPELSLPLALPGASLLVTGGLRQTLYNSSHEKLVDSQKWTRGSGSKERTIPEFSVTAFSQLSREWDMADRALPLAAENVGKSSWTGLKHRIQPRVTYGWVPDIDQSDNPIFEEMDRIKPSQLVRASLTNIVTARRSSVTGTAGAYSLSDSYFDPLRWEIAVGYDVDEANRKEYQDFYSRRPVQDVYSYLEFAPAPWLSLWSRMYVSVYGDGITRSDSGLTLSNRRWGSWNISYSSRNSSYNYREEMKRDNISDIRFTPTHRLLTNTVTVYPLPNISLHAKTTDNLVTGKNYEYSFAVGYHHQCFRIIGSVHSKGKEDAYRVRIELPGLNF